ncbi:MAG: DsrE family protein [Chromatiales bacterium]|nr:DsrE family protein [Chromatiales bacterium]
MRIKAIVAWPVWWLLLSAYPVNAGSLIVDNVLALPEPPAGVVFEIVESQPERLEPALRVVRRDAGRLRGRFPALPIAIVSHGREQFALLDDTKPETQASRELSRALIADGMELSVCGTHAERRGVSIDAFMPGVDVAPEGPARLRDLEALGYLRVRARASDSD